MQKIDAAALRQLLNEQMDQMAQAAASDPAASSTAALMERGRSAYIELIIFGMQEMERNLTDPFDGITAIGTLISNASIHFTSAVEEADFSSDDANMTAQHAMIHVLLNVIDHHLHVLHHNRTPATADPKQVVIGTTFDVPHKEVGDA